MVYKNSDEEVRRGGGTPREVKKGREGKGGKEAGGRGVRWGGCEMDNTMVLLSWKGRVESNGVNRVESNGVDRVESNGVNRVESGVNRVESNGVNRVESNGVDSTVPIIIVWYS